MSLDVYLYGESSDEPCECHCGHKHIKQVREELFSANITHNLGQMAVEAGFYTHVWRPEENGVQTAKDIIPKLETGLALMKADPERFKKFDASNGWGTYDNFVPWIERYLEACKEYPDAAVEVSR